VLKVALVALAALATPDGAAYDLPPRLAPATASDIALDQAVVVSDMLTGYPVDYSLKWIPCGQENAWYHLLTHEISLCLELNDTTAPVFVAAHEAGHALSIQLQLDMGEGPTRREDSADELAALFLIDIDRKDDVMGAVKWFMKMHAEREDGRHASHMERAWKLACLVDGSEPDGSYACRTLYAFTKTYWTLQLAPHAE
jgi:hypothetical protein